VAAVESSLQYNNNKILHTSTLLKSKRRITSTWKSSYTTKRDSISTAFIAIPSTSSKIEKGLYNNNGVSQSRRLTFLSNFMYNTNTKHTHARIQHCNTKQQYIPLFATPEDDEEEEMSSNEDIDIDNGIKNVYDQVQTDDSDWYYKTFAKLLNDKVSEKKKSTIIDDGKDESSGSDIKKEGDDVAILNDEVDTATDKDDAITDMNEDKQEDTIDDERILDQKNKVDDVVETHTEDAAKKVVKEKPSSSSITSSDMGQKPKVQEKQQQFDEEIDELEKQPNIQSKSKERDDYDYYEDYGDYEDYDDYDDYDDEYESPPQSQQEISQAVKKIQDTPTTTNQSKPKPQSSNPATSQTSTPPSQIVRLRNIYTNEIDNLSSLSTLLKLGYTEKEIVVLKPQVLELIVEDKIQRLEKGIPKRWVRLSKLDGYTSDDKNVEEENDEDDDIDYGWEIEIVSSSKINKKKDTVLKDDEFEDDGESKLKQPKSANEKDISEPSKQEEAKQPVSIDESERYETASERSVDKKRNNSLVDTDKQQRQQSRQKREYDEDEAGDNVTYDRQSYEEEDDVTDTQRRPKQQRRRQREYDSDDDGSSYEPRTTPSPPQSQRRSRRRDDSQSQRQPRRRRPQEGQRKELLVDRGNFFDGDDPPPNRFWMDLDTFRDVLRKEAQLRLKILGPDWKESVLDESRWRYDLYKTWLTMLDEGVAEDLLDDYVDRPARQSRGERRRNPPQPQSSRSRAVDPEYDRPPPPRRQQQENRRKQPERDPDDDYDEQYDTSATRRRPRSQASSDGQRSQRREATSSDLRPPPPRRKRSTWKNFSDLEESLQRSSDERRYEYEEDEQYDDEIEDEAPRRRRRRSDRPGVRSQRVSDNDDDEGGSFEDIPRRRRRRRNIEED